MITEGKLDKYGRKNDSTPMNWLDSYKDLQNNVTGGSGDTITVKTNTDKKVIGDIDYLFINNNF